MCGIALVLFRHRATSRSSPKLDAKFDTQAVIDDDLFDIANDNGHRIYLLDEKGTLLDYLNEKQE